MNDQFVPFEIALQLKKLGFDELCLAYYASPKKLRYVKTSHDESFIAAHWTNSKLIGYLKCFMIIGAKSKTLCTAPLYQQVFKWFRNEHSLESFIEPAGYLGYSYDIGGDTYSSPEGLEYEEAELACIYKLIEIVNSQKS